MARRRGSWVEAEGRVAEKARDGFQQGTVTGLLGMALAGLTGGAYSIPGEPKPLPSLKQYYSDKLAIPEMERIVEDCRARGVPLHDALMDRCGWPAIPFDGELLVTHQDALLIGGKVPAPASFADHVAVPVPGFLRALRGQAVHRERARGRRITPGPAGVPAVRPREVRLLRRVSFGTVRHAPGGRSAPRTNIGFRAGAGGLHSTEN